MKRNGKRFAGIALVLCLAIMTGVPVSAANDNQNQGIGSAINYSGWAYTQDGVRYYQGGKPVTGLFTLDGQTFYFDNSGLMQTGWQKVDGKRRYFNEKGEMQTGWVKLSGVRYYFSEDRVPLTGLQTIGGADCLFSSDGVLIRKGTAGAVSDALQSALNGASLSAQSFVNNELNEEIENLLSLLDVDGQDTFAKVRTVYDFMTSSYEVGDGALFVGMDTFLQIMEGPESDALQMLRTGKGESQGYAAAFAAVMRAMGLDCRVVNGTLSNTAGQQAHSWAELNLNGAKYVFDPQQEQEKSGQDRNLYSRFGKTYEELNGEYTAGEYFDFQN